MTVKQLPTGENSVKCINNVYAEGFDILHKH
jgi:hypothetical protein